MPVQYAPTVCHVEYKHSHKLTKYNSQHWRIIRIIRTCITSCTRICPAKNSFSETHVADFESTRVADFESTRVAAHYWVSSFSPCRVELTFTIAAAGRTGPPRYIWPHCLGDSLSRGVRHNALGGGAKETDTFSCVR